MGRAAGPSSNHRCVSGSDRGDDGVWAPCRLGHRTEQEAVCGWDVVPPLRKNVRVVPPFHHSVPVIRCLVVLQRVRRPVPPHVPSPRSSSPHQAPYAHPPLHPIIAHANTFVPRLSPHCALLRSPVVLHVPPRAPSPRLCRKASGTHSRSTHRSTWRRGTRSRSMCSSSSITTSSTSTRPWRIGSTRYAIPLHATIVTFNDKVLFHKEVKPRAWRGEHPPLDACDSHDGITDNDRHLIHESLHTPRLPYTGCGQGNATVR